MDKQTEADAIAAMRACHSPIPPAERKLVDPVWGKWLIRRGMGSYEKEPFAWLDGESTWAEMPEEAIAAEEAASKNKGRKIY